MKKLAQESETFTCLRVQADGWQRSEAWVVGKVLRKVTLHSVLFSCFFFPFCWIFLQILAFLHFLAFYSFACSLAYSWQFLQHSCASKHLFWKDKLLIAIWILKNLHTLSIFLILNLFSAFLFSCLLFLLAFLFHSLSRLRYFLFFFKSGKNKINRFTQILS